MNTNIILLIIFPSLFGLSILIIAVVMVKNISGTITTNIKFIKISPKGLRTLAFSLNINPTIAPIIIEIKSIIVLL